MEVRVEGRVVKIDHRKGDFRDDNGEQRHYDFKIARLLTEEYDTIDLRFDPGGPVAVPDKGEDVHYVCEARASRGNITLRPQAKLQWLYSDLAAAQTE